MQKTTQGRGIMDPRRPWSAACAAAAQMRAGTTGPWGTLWPARDLPRVRKVAGQHHTLGGESCKQRLQPLCRRRGRRWSFRGIIAALTGLALATAASLDERLGVGGRLSASRPHGGGGQGTARLGPDGGGWQSAGQVQRLLKAPEAVCLSNDRKAALGYTQSAESHRSGLSFVQLVDKVLYCSNKQNTSLSGTVSSGRPGNEERYTNK